MSNLIKNIVFTNSVTGVFNVCDLTSLTQVTFPKDARIYTNSFDTCPKLKTIIYKGTEAQWASKTSGITWATGCNEELVVICSDTE